MMKEIPLARVFHWIEPGPVVLVTTAHKGHTNVMTMSWHMMMEFEPPLIGLCHCSFGSQLHRVESNQGVCNRHPCG